MKLDVVNSWGSRHVLEGLFRGPATHGASRSPAWQLPLRESPRGRPGGVPFLQPHAHQEALVGRSSGGQPGLAVISPGPSDSPIDCYPAPASCHTDQPKLVGAGEILREKVGHDGRGPVAQVARAGASFFPQPCFLCRRQGSPGSATHARSTPCVPA